MAGLRPVPGGIFNLRAGEQLPERDGLLAVKAACTECRMQEDEPVSAQDIGLGRAEWGAQLGIGWHAEALADPRAGEPGGQR